MLLTRCFLIAFRTGNVEVIPSPKGINIRVDEANVEPYGSSRLNLSTKSLSMLEMTKEFEIAEIRS